MSDRLEVIRQRVRQEEALALLAEAEAEYAAQGVVPPLASMPFRRVKRLLGVGAAVVLGLLSSAGAVLLTFGIANQLLHLAL